MGRSGYDVGNLPPGAPGAEAAARARNKRPGGATPPATTPRPSTPTGFVPMDVDPELTPRPSQMNRHSIRPDPRTVANREADGRATAAGLPIMRSKDFKDSTSFNAAFRTANPVVSRPAPSQGATPSGSGSLVSGHATPSGSNRPSSSGAAVAQNKQQASGSRYAAPITRSRASGYYNAAAGDTQPAFGYSNAPSGGGNGASSYSRPVTSGRALAFNSGRVASGSGHDAFGLAAPVSGGRGPAASFGHVVHGGGNRTTAFSRTPPMGEVTRLGFEGFNFGHATHEGGNRAAAYNRALPMAESVRPGFGGSTFGHAASSGRNEASGRERVAPSGFGRAAARGNGASRSGYVSPYANVRNPSSGGSGFGSQVSSNARPSHENVHPAFRTSAFTKNTNHNGAPAPNLTYPNPIVGAPAKKTLASTLQADCDRRAASSGFASKSLYPDPEESAPRGYGATARRDDNRDTRMLCDPSVYDPKLPLFSESEDDGDEDVEMADFRASVRAGKRRSDR